MVITLWYDPVVGCVWVEGLGMGEGVCVNVTRHETGNEISSTDTATHESMATAPRTSKCFTVRYSAVQRRTAQYSVVQRGTA